MAMVEIRRSSAQLQYSSFKLMDKDNFVRMVRVLCSLWAMYSFQQLVSGVPFCHFWHLCCTSRPPSTVGTLTRIDPIVMSCIENDGKVFDAERVLLKVPKI
ncbi:serine/threonine-protein kinase SRK2A-like [Apium graveolens]|uniref:serine/threonine-protein kinase SRK2A-like n=1 Tax=Apium graveolens TaxID=4045 RepID=UPI003D7BF24F